MIEIVNRETGEAIGTVPCRLPELGDLSDMRSIINDEFDFRYFLVWTNGF